MDIDSSSSSLLSDRAITPEAEYGDTKPEILCLPELALFSEDSNPYSKPYSRHESLKESYVPAEAEWVTIPDLFVSFVSQSPKSNLFYEEVKTQSEEWMNGYAII